MNEPDELDDLERNVENLKDRGMTVDDIIEALERMSVIPFDDESGDHLH